MTRSTSSFAPDSVAPPLCSTTNKAVKHSILAEGGSTWQPFASLQCSLCQETCGIFPVDIVDKDHTTVDDLLIVALVLFRNSTSDESEHR